MNIYLSNTYRKNLSWLHFNDESMIREAASEGPIVLHIRFYSLFNNSKKQLGAPAQAWQQYSMHDRMLDLERYKSTSGEETS